MARRGTRAGTFLAILAGALVPATAGPGPIDFAEACLYARRGFDEASLGLLASYYPIQPDGWIVARPSPDRGLAIKDHVFPGLAPDPFPGALRRAPEEFTLVFPFEPGPEALEAPDLALLLPRVGPRWALYLNGALVRDELGEGGGERTLRGEIVHLDPRRLVAGPNFLAFRIRGDPGDPDTGLSTGDSFLAGPRSRLALVRATFLDSLLVGAYGFFGLYHLAIFAQRRRNRAYLLFGAGSLLMAFYVFSMTNGAATLVRDTALLGALDHAALFFLLPAFVAFTEATLRDRTSRFPAWATGASLLLAAGLPFLRHSFLRDLWEFGAVACFGWLLLGLLLPRLLADLRARGDRTPLAAFLGSDAGRFMPGALATFAAAAADILIVNSGGTMRWTKWAFLLVVLGAAATLADRHARAGEELRAATRELERAVEGRQALLAEAAANQRRVAAELERSSRQLSDASDAAARDLVMAEHVQRGFFPAAAPAVEGWDIAFAWKPVAGVSGDFYDFYARGGRLEGIALGDIAGTGVGAGLVAVLARSIFFRRFAAGRDEPLPALMKELQAELVAELGSVDEYLTAILLRVDGDRVEYANAAHADILYRKGGAERAFPLIPKDRKDFRGPPLGKEGFEGGAWAALRFAPGPGDLMLAYTDCLVEARNPAGEEYGVARLASSLGRAPAAPARAALDSVLASLHNFTAGAALEDDLSAIVIRRTG